MPHGDFSASFRPLSADTHRPRRSWKASRRSRKARSPSTRDLVARLRGSRAG